MYVDVLPLTIKIVHDQYDLSAETVRSQQLDDRHASLGVSHAALGVVSQTFNDLGAPDVLPGLIHHFLQWGIHAGMADRQVTLLTHVFAEVWAAMTSEMAAWSAIRP